MLLSYKQTHVFLFCIKTVGVFSNHEYHCFFSLASFCADIIRSLADPDSTYKNAHDTRNIKYIKLHTSVKQTKYITIHL